MATTNKEQYNIDQIKKNASTGTTVQNQADLQKYGIDYSAEQRNEIANIFANQADASYSKAQNDYANTMANEQASLRDTIRRSQAQAVATGASRGMQAANELSNMLGLQEQAAQGATQLQGDYANALANAQQQAMDIQNARAQTGAQVAAADLAAEAQKYSVNMDYQANDPYRVLQEISNLRAQGNNAQADALMTGWLASMGVAEGTINSFTASSNPETYQYNTVTYTKEVNFNDNEYDRFRFTFPGDETEYRVAKEGPAAPANIQNIVDKAGIKSGTVFMVDNAPYIMGTNGKAFKLSKRYESDWNNLINKMNTDTSVPKLSTT